MRSVLLVVACLAHIVCSAQATSTPADRFRHLGRLASVGINAETLAVAGATDTQVRSTLAPTAGLDDAEAALLIARASLNSAIAAHADAQRALAAATDDLDAQALSATLATRAASVAAAEAQLVQARASFRSILLSAAMSPQQQATVDQPVPGWSALIPIEMLPAADHRDLRRSLRTAGVRSTSLRSAADYTAARNALVADFPQLVQELDRRWNAAVRIRAVLNQWITNG